MNNLIGMVIGDQYSSSSSFKEDRIEERNKVIADLKTNYYSEENYGANIPLIN